VPDACRMKMAKNEVLSLGSCFEFWACFVEKTNRHFDRSHHCFVFAKPLGLLSNPQATRAPGGDASRQKQRGKQNGGGEVEKSIKKQISQLACGSLSAGHRRKASPSRLTVEMTISIVFYGAFWVLNICSSRSHFCPPARLSSLAPAVTRVQAGGAGAGEGNRGGKAGAGEFVSTGSPKGPAARRPQADWRGVSCGGFPPQALGADGGGVPWRNSDLYEVGV